ncbi:MAG: hypothetical protein IJS07_02490 [Bacteroidales bacterium]|nr:hypothetical protein [Bacteroidales bacterium]
MKKLILTIITALALVPAFAHDALPAGETFLHQCTPRDSVLIADHVEYGFLLEGVQPGTVVQLPQIAQILKDSLGVEIIRDWQIDSLRSGKPLGRKERPEPVKPFDLRAYLTIAPFEEGTYYLPPLATRRTLPSGEVDTLFFDPQVMEVKTMPVDTATFEIHDIKDQITYPVTFAEVAPWLFGGLGVAGLIALAVWLIVRARRRSRQEEESKEPPYLVALRTLEKYRGEKFWAPEKQKQLYSGITDTLRTYMERTFDVNAEEMTTGEIFDALKGEKTIPEDLFAEVRELFELSDLVKFAKAVATDAENAHAIPTAVRFVTSTYQAELDEQTAQGEEARQS